jgi:hypothetical protein
MVKRTRRKQARGQAAIGLLLATILPSTVLQLHPAAVYAAAGPERPPLQVPKVLRPPTPAHITPGNCAASGIPLLLSRTPGAANFGDTVTFRANITNIGPDNCDLTDVDVTITTPDGVSHLVASGVSIPAGSSVQYPVSYVVNPANVANNQVTAIVTATGVSHSSAGDNPASNTTSATVSVPPGVTLAEACTRGDTQLTVSGSTTNAPPGSTLTVTVGTQSATTTTAADGSWSVTIPWSQSVGLNNVSITVSYGNNNTDTLNDYVVIHTVTISGGESLTVVTDTPAISGTSSVDKGAVAVTINGETHEAAVDAAGNWSLPWPSPLANGSYTVTAHMITSDVSCAEDTQGLTVNVPVPNAPPVAANDSYSVTRGRALTVPANKAILRNDTDPDGDSLMAVREPGSGPANGTLTLNPDGTFTYTPNAGFTGKDSFAYRANDGRADSNVATVTITVRRPAPPPAPEPEPEPQLPVEPETPPAIAGVLVDAATGKVVPGALVELSTDFDADGAVDFRHTVTTGPDGTYKITVPRPEWVYIATVTTNVGGVEVKTTHQTVVETGRTLYDAEKKIAGQVLFAVPDSSQPQRPDQVLAGGTQMRAALTTADGAPVDRPVTVSPAGLFEVAGVTPGAYRVHLQVVAPNGQALAATTLAATVKADGELVVGTALIAPTSRVTDAVTGKPVDGASVTLWWADTSLNRGQGRTPQGPVNLPLLPGFPPGQNLSPQVTDLDGLYAWLVFPQGDYYVRARHDGYRAYDSRSEGRNTPPAPGADSHVQAGVLHVGSTLLPYDFQMEPVHRRFILGYPDGTFKPERPITRAEIAAIFARLVQPTPVVMAPPPYDDVAATHWAATYIAVVRQHALMFGDPDGQFRPDAPISRAELAAIVHRYLGQPQGSAVPFADTASHWAEAAIRGVHEAGIVTGYPDGTFKPEAFTIRAEAATMINRMLGRGPLTGRAAPTWPDVPFSHWASGQVEEASSSHSARKGQPSDVQEQWTSDTGEKTW